MGNVKDLTGQRFGRWTVLYEDGRMPNGATAWMCQCDCGVERRVNGGSLRRGVSQSCGCLAKEHLMQRMLECPPNKTHGGKNDRLYNVWRGMIDRCHNENSKYYKHYGARGIQVCDEWRKDYAVFRKWAIAHGYQPDAPKYACTIDRIDNNLGYCPDNCAWHNQTEQCNNRSNNHILTFNGESHTISEWARKIGLRKDTLRRRIEKYGWSVERALSTPNTHTA